jgi:hypothetical protein
MTRQWFVRTHVLVALGLYVGWLVLLWLILELMSHGIGVNP